MTPADADPLRDRILRKVHGQPPRQLGVAVLGPSLNDPDGPATQKRHQIRDALKECGHAPFYLEDLVSEDSSTPIHDEREILSRDTVDWIIVFCAQGAVGTAAEILGLTDYPEIIRKTTILFPYDLYCDGGLVARVIRGSWSPPLLYTEKHFASCSVVAECTGLADELVQAIGLPQDDLPIL